MTRRLRLLPRARSDLADIWLYTARQWSMDQADSYIRGLNDALALLCVQPDLAPRYGKVTPPVRVHRFRSHAAIFTADDSLLEVVRVVHSRSNWQALLAD